MNIFNIDKVSLKISSIIMVLVVSVVSLFQVHKANATTPRDVWFEVQSIDTMKYSRDLAREKMNDSSFDQTIEFQMKNIADLGATHVAIGTPYDEEFLPYLKRWVNIARKYNLNVWYRGNFSGWEGWFEYPSIDAETHHRLLEEFITNNHELFLDGDIFTSCPECENGAIGDPRNTGKVAEFRNFLISEYELSNKMFTRIGVNVKANYFSMNGDVAILTMDKETTSRLDGIMVVDHYVSTPQELITDIKEYKESSGGRIVLGEIGVPIPDIHGSMTEEQKAKWLEEALILLSQEESIVGINYWVFSGGSTALWSDNGDKKPIADVLQQFYKPAKFTVNVSNEIGHALKNANVKASYKTFSADSTGNISIFVVPGIETISISADGYKDMVYRLNRPEETGTIVLQQERETILFKILTFLRKIIGK